MDLLLPVLVAVAAWWLATVIILYRVRLPSRTYARTLVGATGLLLVGICTLVLTRNDVSVFGAYAAFFAALALFGWHEVSYLLGMVSGPRPEACPAECRGWQRFVLGVKTCVYHELAVVATAVLLAWLLADAPNRLGLWTLVVLWLMRWSAKLNIFLGVRNLHAEFWPEHLAYLKSFARESSMNALFPLSIIVGTTVVALLVVAAVGSEPGSAGRTGATLLATLLALATLEHWFLILKLPDELLWQPGLRSGSARAVPATSAEGSGS